MEPVAEPGDGNRASIVFELGFFMGRLGRHRTFLIEPRGESLKLPPQLAGINTLAYSCGHGESLTDALAAVCGKLHNSIWDLGPNR